tara:strand:- start:1001 stop:1489 length:489 start_codon:yes stop_codon:yes gene_type:complete
MSHDNLLDELEMLGFSMLATAIETENPTVDESRYYLQDIERARRETTEDEMPTHVYHRALELVQQYFREYPRGRGINESSQIKNMIAKIIRESKKGLIKEAGLAHHGIFSEDYFYDLFVGEVNDFLQSEPGSPFLTNIEQESIKRVVLSALENVFDDYGESR